MEDETEGEPSGPAFYSLVRPGQAIPREATLVHGIRNEDVREAEPIGAALPKFLRYVGPQTVAGHNIIRFDNRIMDRETGRLLRRGFPNPAVDTLEMAKRLYEAGSGTPESYSLEALLRRAMQTRFRYAPEFEILKEAIIARDARRIDRVLRRRPNLVRASDALGNTSSVIPRARLGANVSAVAPRVTCER